MTWARLSGTWSSSQTTATISRRTGLYLLVFWRLAVGRSLHSLLFTLQMHSGWVIDEHFKKMLTDLQRHWLVEYQQSREKLLVEVTEKVAFNCTFLFLCETGHGNESCCCGALGNSAFQALYEACSC